MRQLQAGVLLLGLVPMRAMGQSVIVAEVDARRTPTVAAVKPYSMKQSVTTTQIYSNGMTSTRTKVETSMRDSRGRLRRKAEISGWPPTTTVQDGVTRHSPGQEKSLSITVWDPADGVSMNWRTAPGSNEVRLLHSRSLSSGRSRAQVPVKQEDDTIIEVKTEKLGTRSLQGVLAQGSRWTTRYPPGFEGNSLELVTTREDWFSQDYGLHVESTNDDPRQGKTVTTLVSFSDQEPDAALFEVPAGYTVVGDVNVEAPPEEQ